VVEVADQWIVVGVAPGRVSALTTMPRQEGAVPSEAATPVASNFSAWLKQTIEKRNGQ
jgi:flagellar protein FliO/FliZ